MTLMDDAAMEALARSFLLGTGRHPVASGPAFQNLISGKGSVSELTALALVGQRLRFRRHGPPPQRSDGAPIEDPRPIVPEAARPLMRRLVGGNGSGADLAARVLADTCRRLRLRPHPFDLPRLPVFVRNYGECLGAYAAAWTERHAKSEDRRVNYFDADAIDSGNWTSARPAARVEFIAAMRGREPDRARQLVETSFAADPAPVRARLLGALVPGLSQADVPFLESLAKDRAPGVRERAQQLLTYIPGTASAQGRLHDLLARTKLSTAGLLRLRKSLILELPANLQSASPITSAAEVGRSWAAAEYAGIGLDAMAAAFGLSVAEMIGAAADDAPLLALFARQASIERRFDVLAPIVREHAVDAWIDAIGPTADEAPANGDGASELPDDAMIEPWCAAALAPGLWPTMPSAAQLERLYGFLRRPLPPAQARELLQSKAFAMLASAAVPPIMGLICLAIAALTPPPLRSEMRVAFAALPADGMSRPLLLLDCLMLLDPSSSE